MVVGPATRGSNAHARLRVSRVIKEPLRESLSDLDRSWEVRGRNIGTGYFALHSSTRTSRVDNRFYCDLIILRCGRGCTLNSPATFLLLLLYQGSKAQAHVQPKSHPSTSRDAPTQAQPVHKSECTALSNHCCIHTHIQLPVNNQVSIYSTNV